MREPLAPMRDLQTAPPTKRANFPGIPVRQYDGALVAHANAALADRLMAAGAAETFVTAVADTCDYAKG